GSWVFSFGTLNSGVDQAIAWNPTPLRGTGTGSRVNNHLLRGLLGLRIAEIDEEPLTWVGGLEGDQGVTRPVMKHELKRHRLPCHVHHTVVTPIRFAAALAKNLDTSRVDAGIR